jgi:hypothetical protein
MGETITTEAAAVFGKTTRIVIPAKAGIQRKRQEGKTGYRLSPV